MTNLTNYHSHCLYCDGRANMEDFIRFAISEGFTSYGISSHAPLLSLLHGQWNGIGWMITFLNSPVSKKSMLIK